MRTPTSGDSADASSGLGGGTTRHHEFARLSMPVAIVNRLATANGQPIQSAPWFSELSIHGTYQTLAAASTIAAARRGRCRTNTG